MSTMISEPDLERLFAEAAGAFAVPDHGPALILAAAGKDAAQVAEVRAYRRERRRAPLVAAAAIVLVLGAGGYGLFRVGGGSDGASDGGSEATSGPAAAAPAAAATVAGPAGPQALVRAQQLPNGAAAGPGSGDQDAAAPLPVAASPAAAASAAPSAAGAPSQAGGGAGAGVQQRIVQTGTLGLAVPKGQVPATVDKLEGAAKGNGGYLQDSQQAETSGSPTGSVTLRVPTASFPGLLAAVRALGTVTSQGTTGTDVTAQYVDLESRLTALRASKSTYLTILSTAKTVQETLSIQQRVDDVQQQIEQLTGQERVLADQSDSATLSVTVAEVRTPASPKPTPAPAAKPRGPWSNAVHTAGHTVLATVRGLVAASGVIGLLLVVLVAGLVATRVVRRTRTRRQLGHLNG